MRKRKELSILSNVFFLNSETVGMVIYRHEKVGRGTCLREKSKV